MFVILKEDWKLAFCYGAGGWVYPRMGKYDAILMELPSVRLYNMKDDIEEQNNLQSEHPEIVEENRSLLSDYVTKSRSSPGTLQYNDSSGE